MISGANGLAQLTISSGHLVLITDGTGMIGTGENLGFYSWDTRLISNWQLYFHGVPWIPIASYRRSHCSADYFFTNPAVRTAQSNIPAGSVALHLQREISETLDERITIVNYGDAEIGFDLSFRIEGDFLDLLELKLGRSVKRGIITTGWREQRQELHFEYRNTKTEPARSFSRGLLASFKAASHGGFANGCVVVRIPILSQGMWTSEQRYLVLDEPSQRLGLSEQRNVQVGSAESCDPISFEARNTEVQAQCGTSLSDLNALRIRSLGADADLYTISAGIPWFSTVFGRDSIIASIQTLLVDEGFSLGTLDTLATYQGKKIDTYTEEQPGKIFHEIRFGEASALGETVFTPFYGTADATILFPTLLHEYWRWTGDEGVVRKYLDTAERCLEWIDLYGDRDGDGFQEYLTQTPAGYYNVGWKDSFDSVRHPDGTFVVGPTALCELQGYVFDAWVRISELFAALGRTGDAEGLRAKAQNLKRKFNDVFWDAPSGIYAYALDGQKQQVVTRASNIGHCLWSGIIAEERALDVAAMLLSPDMSGGWGVRTLSASHPAFNPFSYHNGSVWPHDNSIIMKGLRRYGRIQEANIIMHDVLDAASRFESHRMPEFYAGVQRDEGTRSNLGGEAYRSASVQWPNALKSMNPIPCPQASAPQAWACGSIFLMLSAMLGIEADAPNGKLYVDPHLPDWMPDLTLSGLRIKNESLQLRFRREGKDTFFEGSSDKIVIERRGVRPSES